VYGPSGTGKSHFIKALGHLAIDKGRTVAWHTLETLAQLFRRHRADDSINKAISKLIRSDLTLIDDVGLLPSPQTLATAVLTIHHQSDITLIGDRVADTTANGRHPDARIE
jgi:DNA replication protein DnaC